MKTGFLFMEAVFLQIRQAPKSLLIKEVSVLETYTYPHANSMNAKQQAHTAELYTCHHPRQQKCLLKNPLSFNAKLSLRDTMEALFSLVMKEIAFFPKSVALDVVQQQPIVANLIMFIAQIMLHIRIK